jgi:hypothetical protein
MMAQVNLGGDGASHYRSAHNQTVKKELPSTSGRQIASIARLADGSRPTTQLGRGVLSTGSTPLQTAKSMKISQIKVAENSIEIDFSFDCNIPEGG